MGNLVAMTMIQGSLKSFRVRKYGFGMPTLGCVVLAMTYMCCEHSRLFSRLAREEALLVEFQSNHHKYTMVNYLACGKYLTPATFKPISNTTRSHNANSQAVVRRM